jgi:hypothetical protein
MKWRRSKINYRWMMTRIFGDAIAVREMKWHERVYYWVLSFIGRRLG